MESMSVCWLLHNMSLLGQYWMTCSHCSQFYHTDGIWAQMWILSFSSVALQKLERVRGVSNSFPLFSLWEVCFQEVCGALFALQVRGCQSWKLSSVCSFSSSFRLNFFFKKASMIWHLKAYSVGKKRCSKPSEECLNEIPDVLHDNHGVFKKASMILHIKAYAVPYQRYQKGFHDITSKGLCSG